ncbi:hypothetical protein AM587_10008582 [Phytophthora nicotianae]|uniref:Uncharacterized protein n=1 Tax=Phytophthora nicotianae TaxID=4792 RepID=A0A0W8CRE1_PHYNI|nr:hypothetical protein AM587_10008582 [Phytophthora nicotianae]
MHRCILGARGIANTPVSPMLETTKIDAARGVSRVGCWSQLEEKWNRIQVGRRGSYSIERLISLEHYCKTTSWTRVILVCVLTPIPVLLAAVLLECLPLRSPSEGWVANWVFWIRVFLTVALLAFGGNSQLANLIPDLNHTFCKQLIVATGVAVGHIGVCIFASYIIGFPVPLLMQLGTIAYGILMSIMLRLVFGSSTFVTGSPFMIYMKKLHSFFLAFMTLIMVYPPFKVLYGSVPVAYRGVVVLVLPIWRFAAKQFSVYATRDLEDIMPESAAFFVDFFSSLYISACMSSPAPLYLNFLFIATDLGHILLEIRELSYNAKAVQQYIRQELTGSMHQVPELKNILTIILQAIKKTNACRTESVRLWACLPHPLTTEQTEQLLQLDSLAVFRRRNRSSSDRSTQQTMVFRTQKGVKQSASIVPAPKTQHTKRSTNVQAVHAIVSNLVTNDSDKSEMLILQGLQLLFHCEYLELVEYVECIIPILYVVYRSTLEQLPNIVYYPDGAGSWGTPSAANILLLALLEALSLAFLQSVLSRKFAFSAMHQLAFILETHVYLIQSKLFTGVLLLVPFELKHFGTYPFPENPLLGSLTLPVFRCRL